MKYIDEYRDPDKAKEYARHIEDITTGEWNIMEVCGGQTHAIIKYGINELLPGEISLIHGPGCPVCVTPVRLLDTAMELAAKEEVIFCSFGDMLRVPGSNKDLYTVRSEGGDVRVVYSPLDALKIARENPDKEVVFFAVGFETTAPANAMTVAQAKEEGLDNFSLLVSQVLVPPAMEAILDSSATSVQGFLAAGHVCTVMGFEEYEPLAAKYNVPIVVTGFEPLDILQGVYMTVRQLEEGKNEVENQYTRSVSRTGTDRARRMIGKVFEISDRHWRGIGNLPESGFELSAEFAEYDACEKFNVSVGPVEEAAECIAGQILQGTKKPDECPAFGETCTPENPLGAPMVSSEGACAAYYSYR
ncbi:MAG: hydrogenase formation protein HypD [bacterium]